jgi:hypothetical protein
MRKTTWGAVSLSIALAACGRGGEQTGEGPAPSSPGPVAPLVDPNVAAMAAAAEQERQRQLAEFSCIERVIQADLATEPYGDTIERPAAMRAISMEGCPPEFQIAYVQHIQAWEKSVRIKAALRQLDTGDNFGGAFLTDLVGGALGVQTRAIDSHIDAIETLERERTTAGQEITDTYEVVTTLARNRGVVIPG